MNRQETRIAGRVVGSLMVLLIAGGFLGNFALTARAFAPPGFLVNAAAHSLKLSISVLVGIATGALVLGVAITLYPLLRRHGERLALWLVALAAANFALAAVEQIALMSLVSLSQAHTAASATDEALFQALRGVVAATRNWTHYVHLVVSGSVFMVLFGALYRATLVPRPLAGFGVAAALLQMIAVAMPLFGQPVVFPMLAPLGVAMISTALWLLLRGFTDRTTTPNPVPV